MSQLKPWGYLFLFIFFTSVVFGYSPYHLSHQSSVLVQKTDELNLSKLSQELNGYVRNNSIVEVIVKFKDYINLSQAISTTFNLINQNFKLISQHKLINAITIRVLGQYLPDIAKLDIVDYIAYNRKVSITSLNTSTSNDGLIVWENTSDLLGISPLWEMGLNGTNITVAILDTGIDNTHPDLDDIDDNPDTKDPKVILFKDYVNNKDDLDPSDGITAYDDNGHGTAVAGILAGTGYLSHGKFRGVAPAARIISIKVIDKRGDGDVNDILKGIEFAVTHNADIISMSLGATPAEYDPMIDAIERAVEKGVVVVVAAGNEGPVHGSINSPGNSIHAITVGASYGNKFVYSWSSHGPTLYTGFPKPDIVAPGDYVVTTKRNGTIYIDYPESDSGYCIFSGTSASTPFVSGIVALLKQAYKNKTPTEIKLALMNGAIDLGEPYYAQGAGLANATAAYLLLKENKTLEYIAPDMIKYNVMMFDSYYTFPQVVYFSNNNVSLELLNYTIAGNLTLEVNVTGFTDMGHGYWLLKFLSDEISYPTVGFYNGIVTISTNISTHQIPVEYRILKYAGRVMFDVFHQDQEDPDEPTSYMYLVTSFWDLGMDVVTNREKITKETLDTVDVLVIADEELQFTESELDAVRTWVYGGGILLLFADYYDASTNTSYFDEDSFNALLSGTGISLSHHTTGDGGTFLNEPIGKVYPVNNENYSIGGELLQNVNSIYILYGTSFFIDLESNAEGLIWASKTDALLALAPYGKGYIIACSDASILYDSVVDDARIFKADNYQLLKNIASFVKPSGPVIYSLKLTRDDTNNKLYLEAYILDDDSVPTVVLATRNWITNEWKNVTLSPHNDFVYTAELDVNPLNIYDAYLIITDKDGNTRTVVLNVTYYVYLPLLLTVVAFLGIIILLVFLYFWKKHKKYAYPSSEYEREDVLIFYPE